MKKNASLILGLSILLSACGTGPVSTPTATVTFTSSAPSETPTITPTFTASATFTSSPTPTPTWVFSGPDHVIVPILLYHWIAVSPSDGPYYKSPYYVKPEVFEEEIKLLHDCEYTTISIDMLLKAITEGTELPPRPVLITFDDGHLNNYTTAFPIMEKYGFKGILYVVGNYIGTEDYMNADQIREMAAAGWEVGSHSMSHADLSTLDPQRQRYEVVESREFLEETLGLPVRTIAYPFGSSNSSVIDYAHFAGFIAGMSLGFTHDQGSGNRFTLQRRDIKGTYDVKQFASFLPWQGDPIYLPTDTPTPTTTPTRTLIPTYTQYPVSTPAP